jgi:simple sugar transport system permease protein
VSTEPQIPPEGTEPPAQEGATVRLSALYRSGGLVTALITTLLAFLIGGLVVFVTTGADPLSTYKAIFDGSGLNWLFPWVTGEERDAAATDLQATLILTTSLILTGLAVAFAFRCGMFNIGGQGQYMLGAIAGVWIGTRLEGLPGFAHILLALVVGTLAGAMIAGVAGILKATVGAHEVIVTIMLNWIVYWFGTFLFGLEGPLQNTQEFGQSNPVSNDIVQSAHLHVFWGNPILQGLHVGFFIAIGALVAYWVILNRTTLGYEVRAVGFNPEAARYGGISVARNYFLAMAISGGFAGLAGAIDILGWQFRLAVNDVQISTIGFIGIAVALLGRNTAVGVGFAALLFGALLTGTSTRNTQLIDIFGDNLSLANNLTLMIQGLVVLFVGADVLVLYLWSARKKLRSNPPPNAVPT